MFFKILQKLRQKPEGTRKFITLVSSAGITSIIAIFWAMSYIPYANNILNSNTASVKDALSDFGEIKDVLDKKSPIEEIKNTVEEVNDEFVEIIEYADKLELASSTATTTMSTSTLSTTTKATSTATTSTKILVQ